MVCLQMSLAVQKQNLDANRMRVTSSIVREVVEKNDTHYLSKVRGICVTPNKCSKNGGSRLVPKGTKPCQQS